MRAAPVANSKAILCQQPAPSLVEYEPCQGLGEASSDRVNIALFGHIQLSFRGRDVALNNRKAKALLAYLILTPRMKETRSRLIGLLWSESDETRARACLRQLLHNLREIFKQHGLPGFMVDKECVRLECSTWSVDLDTALASISQGNPEERLLNEAHITETLFSGFEDIDPAFAEWVEMQRETARQRLVRALEKQLSDSSQPIAQLARISGALLQIDPTHELACQHQMRAHVEMGNTAGALTTYKRLWTRLEQEHDVEPSLATQELVVAIKTGAYSLAKTNQPRFDTAAASGRKLSFPR